MPGAAQPRAFYYLHPLAAGPLEQWPAEFDRIAALGFEAVVMAPPFAPGPGGDLFLTADHDHLHPALGGGAAEPALARLAEAARLRGLALLLDVAVSPLAPQAAIWSQHPEWRPAGAGADRPPDPRQAPRQAAGLALPLDPAPPALRDWWLGRLQGWLQAGLAGFRLLQDSAPPAFWRDLLPKLRAAAPQVLLIAGTPGAGPALAGCGFDLAADSLPWWDFSAGWWAEEAARLASLAPALSQPEAPFGPRLAARFHDRLAAERAARRAIRFAALSGGGWMLPMGLEFGALHRMGHGRDEAGLLAALRTAPRLLLEEAVREANAQRASLPPAAGPVQSLAAARGPLVLLRQGRPAEAPPARPMPAKSKGKAKPPRPAPSRVLVLANPSLTRPAPLAAGQILGLLPRPGRLPAGALDTEGRLTLNPGEVIAMPLDDSQPISLPVKPGKRAAEAAAEAPRIAIEDLRPVVDAGRFPVKRAVGQAVTVTADVFTDGATKLAVRLLWLPADESAWREVPMRHAGNDVWTASFVPERVGQHLYTVAAWVDFYAAFLDEISKKQAAGVDIALERREGMALLGAAAAQLGKAAPAGLAAALKALPAADAAGAVAIFADPALVAVMLAADRRPFLTQQDPPLRLEVERRAAGYASWYEIFPRSQSGDAARHGTFDDVIARLPMVRDMGFDVLYFPPIHPIGQKNRKGRNNSLKAEPGDPGSPYAIGAAEGGHDALHPELGTFDDFARLVRAAAEHGLELALDFAIQCSPDHPWLKDHPDWFAYRPDGSIRYAENPPKKYEDIVNVDFYAPGAIPELWITLRDVVLFWVQQGIKLFRVDNPHTKPLPFWEWMIGEVRARDPEVVFLSEAFTRPKVMYRLAKVGYSQSYTYFTWRNTAWEMGEYIRELNQAPVSDFFRPHFFVNTPDINPTFLQESGRPGHLIRAALAATLSGLWGVYNGFEICEARPVKPGKEEYLDSEKYELKVWDYDRPGHIKGEITRLNAVRRENPALQTHLGTTILASGHEGIMLYVKRTPDGSNTILCAVSMDPRNALETHIELPQHAMGLDHGAPLLAENLFSGGEERWEGSHHWLRLDPHNGLPFAIWRLRAAN